MITVIIAGGSGTRLWPLSTPDYPKHLLKINGDSKSLLQNTYERAKNLSQDIYVISEASHAEHVRSQLPGLTKEKVVVEPARRGTANCIVVTLAHLADSVDPDEPIAFIAADHFVRDTRGFAHSFKVASDISREQNRIVLVGVEPDHPATGFGYIKKDGLADEERFVYKVNSFKEKPELDVARGYVKSGDYLWNCSYFVASLNTFKKNFKKHAPTLGESYERLVSAKNSKAWEKIYLGLEADSIDYALIEHVDDLLVVPAAFDWMDLGSFGDLHKAVGSDETGNYIHGEHIEMHDVENSYVHSHGDKPVALIGLDNVVVINTKDGILVARKDLAQKVGDVSKKLLG